MTGKQFYLIFITYIFILLSLFIRFFQQAMLNIQDGSSIKNTARRIIGRIMLNSMQKNHSRTGGWRNKSSLAAFEPLVKGKLWMLLINYNTFLCVVTLLKVRVLCVNTNHRLRVIHEFIVLQVEIKVIAWFHVSWNIHICT